MSTHLLEPLVTVEHLASAPDDGNRYELIEGVIQVSSAPAIPHQVGVVNLCFIFKTHLNANPVGQVLPGIGIIFDPFNGVIPDVVYASHERCAEIERDGRFYGAPDIVIEILSPGKENEDRDRNLKLQLYSRFGVLEYWIANTRSRTIEVYRRRDAALYLHATFNNTDTLTTPILPDFSCAVADIFKP